MSAIRVSIIIVHYRATKELFDCLSSIKKTELSFPHEVIVVDNDSKNLEKELKEKFPETRYLKSPGNIGFGAANNLGVNISRGELLFFTNPDTLLFNNTLPKLVDFLTSRREADLAAPVLLKENHEPYPLQAGKLTPLSAVFALSFINKYFPGNPVSRRYWLKGWQEERPKEVETAPGTAFLVRRQAFEKAGGFDPKIFLFFEEMDLCLRIKKMGGKIFLVPQAKIIHLGERSTQKNGQTQKIFRQSRFYYFEKHFGTLAAILVESFLRGSEWLAQLF